MCGISVLFNKHKVTKENYIDFLCSLKKINHRGPDDEGVVLINTKTNDFRIVKNDITSFSDNRVSDIESITIENYNLILGHKRLSIIDLSAQGHQPMQGIDGSWIVFNGEIFNYIELKEELKHYGCQFHTHSDTEVVLEAYRIWGKECLNKFNGMWSIFIWDATQKKMFISNDRFGVKPLYYYEHQDGFNFVSETKQFNAFHLISLKINQSHINDFVNYGYVDVDESTMYENIYRFKKSNYIIVDSMSYQSSMIKDNQIIYYFVKPNKRNITEKNAIEEFRFLLRDSVKLRMRADVDFGFALSGGLDSSAILYMARTITQSEKSGNTLLGFSAIFPGYNMADESAFVNIVADDLPCKTAYSYPMDDFNFDAFEKHIYHQEEPLTGTSFFAPWSIYQKVKESGVKILFNGQGADEVFAGYHHHFYRYCRQLLIKGKLMEYFSLVNQYAELKGLSTKTIHQTVFNEVKLKTKMMLGIAKFDNKMFKYWNKIDSLDEILLRDFDTFQIPTFLRVDDLNSMAFGVESRHPFMDYKLVEFGYSLPNDLLIKEGWQKYIIRKSMPEMPEAIRFRKDKKGFTTPHDVWLSKYKDNFEEYLSYNENFFGRKNPSSDPYKNYVLGTWLKVNNVK
jgi:asparagine synthase (glutamine-hydrolysing)